MASLHNLSTMNPSIPLICGKVRPKNLVAIRGILVWSMNLLRPASYHPWLFKFFCALAYEWARTLPFQLCNYFGFLFSGYLKFVLIPVNQWVTFFLCNLCESFKFFFRGLRAVTVEFLLLLLFLRFSTIRLETLFIFRVSGMKAAEINSGE